MIEVLLSIRSTVILEMIDGIGVQPECSVSRGDGIQRQAMPDDLGRFRIRGIGERNQFPVDSHDGVLETRCGGVIRIDILVDSIAVVLGSVDRLHVG